MCVKDFLEKRFTQQTKNTFFNHKNDRPIIITLYDDVVMLQRAQGGCLGTESR